MMDNQHILEEQVPLIRAMEEKTIVSLKSIENGALLPGGSIPLTSRQGIGLLFQFAAVGFVFTLLPALNYPIFNVYLQMEGYQTASYSILVSIGWSFKFIFGLLSDCIPIFGYRRKSWMLIGWSTCILCLSVMIYNPLGSPYCDRIKTKYCKIPLSQIPTSELKYFNFHAPDQGTLFIILSMFVSIGYVIAECASDAMVIEYGQREPMDIRGRLQTIAFAVRHSCGIPALLLIAFGLNGTQYNGSFSFSLAPTTPYMFSLIPCFVASMSVIFLVCEVPSNVAPDIAAWWHCFWALVQQRVMWQICAFKFLNGLLRTVAATPLNPIKTLWANVEPVTDSLSTLIGTAFFCSALVIVSRIGLNWSWRRSLLYANLAIILLDSTVILLTTWDVYRNQWFFAGVTMFEQIPNGMIMIIGSFCAVEMADTGTEGATYGLLTSLANLTYPLSSALYKYLDSYFLVSQNDIKVDSTAVRWDVTYVYLISYGCKLSALVPLVLLPPQKYELQKLKSIGGSNRVAGGIVLLVCGISLMFSVSTNILAIIPATKCFRLAGGNGQVGPHGWCVSHTTHKVGNNN